MHAMILAAGRGERMRPLTDQTPKPMLAVRGKPLIQWHLEALARAGFQQVVINVAHLGEQIQRHVGDGQRFGLTVRYSQEPEGALETAGGIATARPWEDAHGQPSDQPFLVINADIFTDWPVFQAPKIATELSAQGPDRPACHLVLVDNPGHHPEGDFSLSENPASGRSQVLPRSAGRSLTFSGIGVYDRHMFDDIPAGTRKPLAPLLHQAIDRGRCLGSYHQGIWSDVGTPERLATLNQLRER
jgi:MurNAc alpha-1-phosphate uridylyltransferase